MLIYKDFYIKSILDKKFSRKELKLDGEFYEAENTLKFRFLPYLKLDLSNFIDSVGRYCQHSFFEQIFSTAEEALAEYEKTFPRTAKLIGTNFVNSILGYRSRLQETPEFAQKRVLEFNNDLRFLYFIASIFDAYDSGYSNFPSKFRNVFQLAIQARNDFRITKSQALFLDPARTAFMAANQLSFEQIEEIRGFLPGFGVVDDENTCLTDNLFKYFDENYQIDENNNIRFKSNTVHHYRRAALLRDIVEASKAPVSGKDLVELFQKNSTRAQIIRVAATTKISSQKSEEIESSGIMDLDDDIIEVPISGPITYEIDDSDDGF